MDSKSHDISVFFDVDPRVAVNTDDQEVVWGRARAGSILCSTWDPGNSAR